MDERTSKQEEIVDLSMLNNKKETMRNLILGSEKSGKTALCKILFKTYYDRGFVPVYIESIDIKGHALVDIQKTVYKNYERQYSSGSLEHYKQLSYDRKILFIEDWGRNKLNAKYKSELLKNICSVYPNVFITGDDMLRYFDFIDESDKEQNFFEGFEKLEVMQFGHLKRSKLIDKWNTLGQDNLISDKMLAEKNDMMARDVNVVIGNNFVPSYPFFLMILLQTAESGLPHNNKESAYGYYYELLITQSFVNLKMQHNEIDAYYTYISELAYHFFEKDISEVTKEEFQNFNNCFNKEYDSHHQLDKMLKRLLNSSILESQSGSYKFKYRYIYYYFVAKYLSTRLAESEVRRIVIKMCADIYIEEYANIFMFLTHLSKDPYILEEINKQAKQVFNEIIPTTLDNDITRLNKLAIQVPKIVYKNIEVKKHREERLIAMDEEKEEQLRRDQVIKREENKKNNSMDDAAKLNVAFKTIEILGQILRNHYGSIKADQKYMLAEEAYLIGLRTLGTFLTALNENIENIAVKVQRIIEQEEVELNKSEIEHKASLILFNLSCAISYHTIRKVAESVGSNDLYSTYQKITDRYDTVAVKLIEVSIKLDQSRSLPYNYIKKLTESISGNIMAESLLKVLVI
ncbi:hypothetical protein, partial [Saccharibacillus sacchari]